MNLTLLNNNYISIKKINRGEMERATEKLLELGYPPGLAVLLAARTEGGANPFPDDPNYNPKKLAEQAQIEGKTIYQAVGQYVETQKERAVREGKPFEFSANAMNTMAYQMAAYQIAQQALHGEEIKIQPVPKGRRDRIRKHDKPETILASLCHTDLKPIRLAIESLRVIKKPIPENLALMPRKLPTAGAVIQAFSQSLQKGQETMEPLLKEVFKEKHNSEWDRNEENSQRSSWAKINKEVNPADLLLAITNLLGENNPNEDWYQKLVQRCLWKCQNWGNPKENLKKLANAPTASIARLNRIAWSKQNQIQKTTLYAPALTAYLMAKIPEEKRSPVKILEEALGNYPITPIRAVTHCLPLDNKDWEEAIKKARPRMSKKVVEWLKKKLHHSPNLIKLLEDRNSHAKSVGNPREMEI